jgi:hypothetical protein
LIVSQHKRIGDYNFGHPCSSDSSVTIPAWVCEWDRSEGYISEFSCYYKQCTGQSKFFTAVHRTKTTQKY